MRELHTIYGRCYSVIFGEDLKSSSEYYTITFNMTHIEKLLIFAGEEYNDVGLFGGFFPITPTVISLRYLWAIWEPFYSDCAIFSSETKA